ncbi:endo-1,4-beta-xylanase [Phytoactinopolyspora limicola]|uniref:endo-1,4-beta-xylanase n=1 Tax=Phytoactinopolyspora limicola TaxID=2715536 RepID=UPI00140AB842|nr:endo-1,4-beta-xylanase [Phytoactinopolyspora limicola]
MAAVHRAFSYARAQAPRGPLTLNISGSEAFSAQKMPLSVELLKRAFDAGAPPDVIGLQAHLGKLNGVAERLVRGLDAFSEFGLPIHITEITFKTDGDNTFADEDRQARDVEAFYTYMFSRPEVKALNWWDLTDRHSFSEVGGLLRRDLSPKPAYDVLTELIRRRWSTDTTTSIENGEAHFRGFFGDYEAEVRLPNGSTEHATFTLHPEIDQPVALQVGTGCRELRPVWDTPTRRGVRPSAAAHRLRPDQGCADGR